MLTTLLFALEIRFFLKIEVIFGEFNGLFIIKQIEKWGEVGRNTRLRLVFPPTLLLCSSRFLRTLQQNRAQSRLLYLLIRDKDP